MALSSDTGMVQEGSVQCLWHKVLSRRQLICMLRTQKCIHKIHQYDVLLSKRTCLVFMASLKVHYGRLI